MPGDRDRCLSEGMDDYLAKQVELKNLAEVLAKWVPGRDRGSPRDQGNLTASRETLKRSRRVSMQTKNRLEKDER
jgi:hypothetical protein